MESGEENVNLACDLKTMLKQKFISTESTGSASEPPPLPNKSTLRRNIEIEESDTEHDDHGAFAIDDYVPEAPLAKDIAARKRTEQIMKKMVSFSGSEIDSETETDASYRNHDIMEEDSDILKHRYIAHIILVCHLDLILALRFMTTPTMFERNLLIITAGFIRQICHLMVLIMSHTMQPTRGSKTFTNRQVGHHHRHPCPSPKEKSLCPQC